MKEVDIQRSILDLVRDVGGFGFKMSNQFLSGVPDLFVVLPTFAPVLMEVKNEGEVKETTIRKVGVTPLQREKLLRLNQLGNFGMVATAFKLNGENYVTITRPEQERIDFGDALRSNLTTIRRKGKFNLARVFTAYRVP